MNTGLTLLVVVTAALIAAVVASPRLAVHLEHAKSTEFCVSCHVMEPYGASLHYDDLDYLPASHFQNGLVPREKACYTCHTQYTMFGDIHAKLGGLKHVWIYYTGQTPEQIELYEPYNNRECLHCHGESRSFVEGELHVDMLGELRSNEVSCLECHEFVHDAANAADHESWTHTE